MNKDFSFYLLTDLHYFSPSLTDKGPAYVRRSRSDQKCLVETNAIIDAQFEQLAKDKDTDTIIIPGDLVFDGEKQNHLELIEKLKKLKDEGGKKIYLITARHDYHSSPCGYFEDGTVPVEGTKREELASLYHEYGFDSAISVYEDGLSYVAQLSDGIRLLALNCDGDCQSFKGLYEEQLVWAQEQIAKAHKDGCYIFAMTHYPLLPGSPVLRFIDDAHLTDWEKTADRLADAGLDLIFTGHMHMQSFTQRTSAKGNTITDICTGSLVGCPAYYRKVTISDGTADIKSIPVCDFDYDKGGLTSEEYFKKRFDTVITDIVDAMAYDFNAFTSRFGGPDKLKAVKVPIMAFGKLLQKIKIKNLGALIFVKPDKSIENIYVKDIAVELARNIFVGNEPYVKGTAVYAFMDKMLDRLSFVTKIAKKKLRETSLGITDIKAFVLSLIGDEKQCDYDAKLEIRKMSADVKAE